MVIPPNQQQDIRNLISNIAEALESVNPRQPLRTFFARLLFAPKRRLLSAMRRIGESGTGISGISGEQRFVAAYKELVEALDSLNGEPANLAAMDEIIDILDCLNGAGILSDAQKQEAVRARQEAARAMTQHLVALISEAMETKKAERNCLNHVDLIVHVTGSGQLRAEDVRASFEGAPAYPRFAVAYDRMMDRLSGLSDQPYDLDAMNAIVDVMNSLSRIGVLTDAQKQAAVRARHSLDNVSIEETYEADSGGMSGSDPCPPSIYTEMRTPASLDF